MTKERAKRRREQIRQIVLHNKVKFARSVDDWYHVVGSLYGDGRILMTNPERPEMGVHILWRGQACDDCPMDQKDLVNHLVKAKFSFSRIDLAVDAINFNF